MLLTSGQISAGISSFVVFLFTSLLFLSGYVLQQRTVHSLQQAIKPVQAQAQHNAQSVQIATSVPKTFGNAPAASENEAHQSTLSSKEDDIAAEKWSQVAYVQLVADPTKLCASVMLFGTLHDLKSPAHRVLMFPKTWAITQSGEVSDPYLSTSRRLLKIAAKRYGVILKPLDPLLSGTDESAPSSYPLSLLYSLTEYTRLIHLSSSSIILDSSPLDNILTFPSSQIDAETISLDALTASASSSLFLISPSQENHQSLAFLQQPQVSKAAATTILETAKFPINIPPAHAINPDGSHVTLSTMSSSLRNIREDTFFNSTAFWTETAFVHLWDPPLRGPEYEVPREMKQSARPRNQDAAKIWDMLYDTYKGRRYDHCGLELDIWRGD
ncbi:glycosyltransferase family 8 protein [Xylona heveae TC161]|uniref:Glycosyltransferase family 8 protein n=1 Tax=Xylona heveae (strain CBS 132557 / TC161) TaxID=1328760 RepID=A0A165H561_XYLHT|nr:glycosyltransferase family 8 protein [Xylona heveae TC161]KZF22999.1 glycosyltransferase family 8 protein [Xylona heveae TC161]